MFKFLRYLEYVLGMIPAKFCADLSDVLKDITIRDKFQNGRQAVCPILAKSLSTHSLVHGESVDSDSTEILIFSQSIHKL